MKVRDVFFEEIYKRIKQGDDIVIVSSDIGAPSLDAFRADFPERFINVGIAEQNSIAVAAGLSLAGKKVITYGLNPFPVTRAFDQIRNIANSMKIPITITALNAGSCTAEAGYSHSAIENMSLMRTLKNIELINLSDEKMAKSVIHEIIKNPKPRYIQFDKYIEGDIYDTECIDWEKGFIEGGKRDADTVIITYGVYVQELYKLELPCKIVDCFCLPIKKDDFFYSIMNSKQIITIEDSIDNGGIGSMVLEILNDKEKLIPVRRLNISLRHGYPSKFFDRNMLWSYEGIDMESVKNSLKQLMEG